MPADSYESCLSRNSNHETFSSHANVGGKKIVFLTFCYYELENTSKKKNLSDS